MSQYHPQDIEPKWQAYWEEKGLYRISNQSELPKYYVLDMFPYPSGAGLHVGHPLGYIASDIFSRYKRHKGFNVLHPMGFDAFGLPAEQYAIETGQHPAVSTDKNIATFKAQLGKIGFCYDWSREFRTCQPDYYRWTQWIFQQLFQAWYDRQADRARPIAELLDHFGQHGNAGIDAACDEGIPSFSATQWKAFPEKQQADILLGYRLTYRSEIMVNWCPALGTVLANDEVKDGFSERGGHPVVRKKMPQWMMRITAYADRLLRNLDSLDWSDAMKEMQRNWIGKSVGCELDFRVKGGDTVLTAFTTRPDTIYGVTYVTLAPEHELAVALASPEQRGAVQAYVEAATNRSERERIADVKTVSGVFTGAYVVNPITNEEIPLWVADYVLAGYGTGVVMGVPSSDDRDYRFAQHFGLPVVRVIAGTEELDDPTALKDGPLINSGPFNGMMGEKIAGEGKGEAARAVIDFAVKQGLGKPKTNFRMRDAAFGRQRYWGEPIPVYYDAQGIARLVPEEQLPLRLPEVDKYLPTESGEPPLGRASEWKHEGRFEYELTTMPGWAGSSWYFLRYMDPHNSQAPVSKEAAAYWGQVDLYIGGTEHATGHLLYSRFWNLFLYDLGLIGHQEPFQKLVNQGMIQGRSNYVYKLQQGNVFVSHGLKGQYDESDLIALHVDVNIVQSDVLDLEAFKRWRPEYADAEFLLEDGKYVCGWQVEKMSKRWYNVVNPDDIVAKYGADTLRMYEMFLGPLEISKPWNTDGIEGVSKFLRRFWKLYHSESGEFFLCNTEASAEERKALHKTLKKVEEDIEKLSFNTCVSTFMVCVNELTALKCNKEEVLKPLLVALAPFAPHIAEELWQQGGYEGSVVAAPFPAWNEAFLVEDTFEYPISINGKMRAKISVGADMPTADIERQVLASEAVQRWLEGKTPKKVIVVPKRIVNIVL
jgi:leucyl-tRNA synthetase